MPARTMCYFEPITTEQIVTDENGTKLVSIKSLNKSVRISEKGIDTLTKSGRSQFVREVKRNNKLISSTIHECYN